MTTGAWISLVAIAVTVVGSVMATFVALYSKLSKLEAKVDALNNQAEHNRADHQRIWDKLDAYEHRITNLEASAA